MFFCVVNVNLLHVEMFRVTDIPRRFRLAMTDVHLEVGGLQILDLEQTWTVLVQAGYLNCHALITSQFKTVCLVLANYKGRVILVKAFF